MVHALPPCSIPVKQLKLVTPWAAGFRPLKDKALFDGVYVDYGAPVWDDGAVDIAPEYLYKNGTGV